LARETRALVVLSGGKSSRFGANKGLFEFEGVPLVKRVIDSLGPLSDTIVVSVAPGQSGEYRKILRKPIRIIEDSEAYQGPLFGLKDTIRFVIDDLVLLSACDMPFIRADLYSLMLDRLDDHDAVMPILGGYNEPLTAVYRLPSLKRAIKEAVGEANTKLSSILKYLSVLGLPEDELKKMGIDLDSLTNLNKPPSK
jgi:molybdopterin-guanine dinucleotide biosynthesis protein A